MSSIIDQARDSIWAEFKDRLALSTEDRPLGNTIKATLQGMGTVHTQGFDLRIFDFANIGSDDSRSAGGLIAPPNDIGKPVGYRVKGHAVCLAQDVLPVCFMGGITSAPGADAAGYIIYDYRPLSTSGAVTKFQTTEVDQLVIVHPVTRLNGRDYADGKPIYFGWTFYNLSGANLNRKPLIAHLSVQHLEYFLLIM